MRGRAAWIFAIAWVYFGLFLPRPVTFLGGGWNEKSRLALTRAIVEHRTLTIDAYHKETGDKARYRGHYFSDKAPGLSLAAVPVYALIYGVEHALGSHRHDDADPMDVLNWWLVTLFVVSLPCAVGAVLFDRLCIKWTNDSDASFFATLALIFATPYSFYASVFVGHGLAAALSIAVVYMLFKEHRPTTRDLFVAGLLSGAGIATEYPFALLAAIVLGYIFLERRKARDISVYILGMLPSLLVLATYLTLAFGSPFRLGYTLEARPEFAAIHRAPLLGFSLPSPTAFLGITVSPFRGIFFFCPVLILGLLGLFTGLGKKPPAVPRGLMWTLVAGYLVANAAYSVWDGGDLPLARHSLIAVPFLTAGIALWRTGFNSAPARWLFLLSAFDVMVFRLNIYHSVANYNPLFDLALPNLLLAKVLPTAGSLAGLPGVAALILHLAVSGGIVFLALRNLKRRNTKSASGMSDSREPRKRFVEAAILSIFLVGFLFFLAQSRMPEVFPPRWRLSLVNEELLKSAFFRTYRELLETNPDDPDANWVMGTYYGQRGECTSAVPLLERALSLGREEPSIYEWLARCYSALGDPERARSYREQASRKSRDNRTETEGAPPPPAPRSDADARNE